MTGEGSRWDCTQRTHNWALRIGVPLLVVLLLFACGQQVAQAEQESILQIAIPGTENPTLNTSGTTQTRLLDVTGSWIQVSVDLASIVQREGWQIESLNCVGTGNDVIAKKNVEGQWLLLESGAGERGAGIIVRPDPTQTPPVGGVTITGNCPPQFVDTVS